MHSLTAIARNHENKNLHNPSTTSCKDIFQEAKVKVLMHNRPKQMEYKVLSLTNNSTIFMVILHLLHWVYRPPQLLGSTCPGCPLRVYAYGSDYQNCLCCYPTIQPLYMLIRSNVPHARRHAATGHTAATVYDTTYTRLSTAADLLSTYLTLRS